MLFGYLIVYIIHYYIIHRHNISQFFNLISILHHHIILQFNKISCVNLCCVNLYIILYYMDLNKLLIYIIWILLYNAVSSTFGHISAYRQPLLICKCNSFLVHFPSGYSCIFYMPCSMV